MDLSVEWTCLDSDKTERIKITIKQWNSRCVKELKKILEDEIQVPACDQVLSYEGRPLNDDLFPLKKLYLRQGDTVSVQCTAQGSLSDMKSLVQEIKDFSQAITCKDQRELLTVSLKKDFRTSYVSYDHIARALESLSFTFFIPWKNASSLVHRHYFVQEGGFDAFMEVLKFASKRYRIEGKSNSRKLFGKLKDKDSEELAEQLKDLNNEQMILQMHCLSLLWNFSETLHDRRLVLQKGGLELVIKALMLDPNEYPISDEYYEVASINETAVGCLVQYAEFSDCQEVIARKPDTVSKLMFMVASQFQFNNIGGTSVYTYNRYSAQIAANTLFCCACSLQTPRILVESGMHQRMIKLMSLLSDDDLALSYYCTLFLARTRASALVSMDPHTANCIDNIITSFLTKKKPDDVSKWEEDHNYVWVTMIPFASLAFSGRADKETDVPLVQSSCKKHGEKENGGTLCECFASEDETDGPNILPEKKNDHVKGSNTSCDKNVSIRKQMQGSVKYSNSDTVMSHVSDQLLVMKEGRSQITVGSRQTQKFGLFTLQHMLNSSGNQQLVQVENLLPYLDCLCWHVNADDGRLLKAELRRHWAPQPASLAVICKASLAFVYGFEAALNM